MFVLLAVVKKEEMRSENSEVLRELGASVVLGRIGMRAQECPIWPSIVTHLNVARALGTSQLRPWLQP